MNTRTRAQLLTTFLFILYSISLFSQEQDILIKGISLSGLKRTKNEVLLQIIEPVKVGEIFTDQTEEIIIQNLRETGIFVPEIEISTEILNNEAYIHILVQDKWTLVPIPIISISKGDSWNAGLLTIENNLFGYSKTLGLGVFYGSEGWTLLSFFEDKHIFQSDLFLSASLSGGQDNVIDLNAEEVVIREYQSNKLSVRLGVEYPVFGDVFIGGALEYDLSLRDENSPTILQDINSLGLKGTIGLNNIYYDIPYEKGITAQFSASMNREFQDQTFFPVISSDIQWSFTPWFRHLIALKAFGGWGQMPVQKQFRIGGLDGSRILPKDNIAADEYASFAFIYNIPVLTFKIGTISAKVFYEAGYFKSDLIQRTFFHGPGIGLEFFIKNLAIPAVGFNLGWNLETMEMQFSVGIGK